MKTIGGTTIYRGTEHDYMKGHQVRIVAVLKNAARHGIDPDDPTCERITDDETLARAGGVSPRSS